MVEEECNECKLNAGAIVALQICDENAEDKSICKELYLDFTSKRISPEDLIDKLIEAFEGREDVINKLKEIKKMLKE